MLTPFQPTTRPLDSIGLSAFPLEGKVEHLLEARDSFLSVGEGWSPIGLNRGDYLDLMETILRAARAWQDENGAIIDPVLGSEWGQTTSRFASSGAILLANGRMPDLLPQVVKAMDWVCERLPRGLMDAPDFQTREIMTAYTSLKSLAQPNDLQRWADGIRAIEPEKVYKVVSPDGDGIERLHNWNLYLCAGEIQRWVEGLNPNPGVLWGADLFHKYAPVQLRCHFTEYGMYRDPADPITYDIQSRLQLAIALAGGYQGELRLPIEEVLRRGALTTLLFLTPDGLVPFGGRSDGFHFREIAVAALCELEARRYKESDQRLAGAFKRQAHLSTRSIRRWLVEMHPHRHLKNGFDPLENWGTDRYGFYSVYSLLTASLLGLAAQFADDSIAEQLCPAEIGGYAFELKPAFHKIFANCRGTSIEIDTAGDPRHNATGLGSVQRQGAPTELALAMPFTSTPDYNLMAEYRPEKPLAIGPGWQQDGPWRDLAECSKDLTSALVPEVDLPDRQRFTVVYREKGVEVREQYELSQGKVRLRASVSPARAVRMRVPLLASDGDQTSTLHFEGHSVRLDYRGAVYRVTYDPDTRAVLDLNLAGNRNGIYRTLVLEKAGQEIEIELEIIAIGNCAYRERT